MEIPAYTPLAWLCAILGDIASGRCLHAVSRQCVGRTKSKCVLAAYLSGVGKSDIGIRVGSDVFHGGIQRDQRIGRTRCNRGFKEPGMRQSRGWPI